MSELNELLLEAIDKVELARVQELIEAGADVNFVNGQGDTPLLFAISLFSGTAEEVKVFGLLLEKGANPNARDSTGETLLHKAVNDESELGIDTGHHIEFARLLLQYGADIEATNSCGDTALDDAIHMGWTDYIELLNQWKSK
jgi:ankyrin repeat protein